MSNYLVLGVIGQIGINHITFGSEYTVAQNISSALSIVLVSWQVVFPITLFAFYVTSYKKHVDPEKYAWIKKKGTQQMLDKYLKRHWTREQYKAFYRDYGSLIADYRVLQLGIWIVMTKVVFKLAV